MHHGGDQRQQFIGRHTRLAGRAVDIDLQANLQRRQCVWPLLGQALGDLEPVHGLDPVKVFSHQPGLVTLDRTNAVPLQTLRPRQRHGAHGSDFFYPFLYIVLAKAALTGEHRLAHGVRAEGFGDSQ